MFDRIEGLFLACVVFSCARPEGENVGTRSDAIIAGRESGSDQDAVVLLYQSARNQTCTGTMVAPNLLVTARHCVAEADANGVVTDYVASGLRVFAGVGALGALRADENEPATRGKELVVPTSRSLYPDVAYVVLERPLSTPVAAMRLSRGVGVGETLGVIGYGVDETGRRPATRMQRGGLVVSQIGPGRSQIGERIMRGELVFGEAACSGDSGGPAFSTTTGALVAIASRVGNGTEPSADSPASFCTGDTADDVYTDFTPIAEVTTRAFAAAGAAPVLEDAVSPPKEGELASANLDIGDDPSAPKGNAGETSGGCHAARGTTAATTNGSTPLTILLGVAMALRIASRRARSSRVR